MNNKRITRSIAVMSDAPPMYHRELIMDLAGKRDKGIPLSDGEVDFLINALDEASNRLFGISMQTKGQIRNGAVFPVRSNEANIAIAVIHDIEEMAHNLLP
jgi:hypothetical protein